MTDQKDPFRVAEAQAAEQKQEREEGQQPGTENAPTTADYEAYDEEVGENVKAVSGASAGGPAI